MYLLRRAALRNVALSQISQTSTLRVSTSRIAKLPLSKPSIYQSFHQSCILRIDEVEKKSEELKEEAIGQAEVAGTAAQAAGLAEQAANQAETAQDAAEASAIAAEAAEVAVDAAEGAQAAAVETSSTSTGNVTSTAAEMAALRADSDARYAARSVRSTEHSPREASDIEQVVFVGNLFFEVTRQQLEQEFSKYGRILRTNIATRPDGLSRGFGYVTFSSNAEAQAAIQGADQAILEGRRMTVQAHQPRLGRAMRLPRETPVGQHPPSSTLFIGNMSFSMSDKDLNDLFRDVKDVLDVRVAIDRRTSQPRGFAHADFVDVAAAERAKKFLESQVIHGRQLRVDFSKESTVDRRAVNQDPPQF